MILGLALLLLIGVGVTMRAVTGVPAATLNQGAAIVQEFGKQAATVARAFREQTVREEFLSSSVKLTGTSRLQVATLQENETFRRKESDSVMWGLIALPEIVVQADMPVEYTYYFDFNGPWEFKQEDKTVTVFPPPIVPNTPAADVSKLTFYTLEGHVWQDDKAVRQRLQDELSKALRDRAEEHVKLVREIGRRQLEEFVSKWMADSFSDGHDFHVKVVFPDERLAGSEKAPALAPEKNGQ